MPKVFLCHASVDKAFVRKLATDLSNHKLSVWIDEKEILVGDPIRQKIEEGLKESDYLAIVLSSASVNSAWVSKELDAKLVEEIESKRVIVLPVLLEDCTVPPFLKGKHYADFRSDYAHGLDELLARFTQQDRETAVKQKVLSRLAVEAVRVDPHKLIPLAIEARQLDAAQELIGAHGAAHPGCTYVAQFSRMIDLIKFSIERTPEAWIRAIDGMIAILQVAPAQGNFQSLQKVVADRPKSDKCLAPMLSLLRLCREEVRKGERRWSPIVAAILSGSIYLLTLTDEQTDEVTDTACELLEVLEPDILRNALSELLRVASHTSEKIADKQRRSALQSRLVDAAEKKIQQSHEYSLAFLHLAWLYALIGRSDEARGWLSKYRLTVAAPDFEKRVQKHKPLDELLSGPLKGAIPASA